MQDITNMVLFARIIEAGSISAAARKLGMPKSTLSRRLAELETAQGLRLVHRGTRKLTLTDIGREFLGHCQVIAGAVEAAEQLTKEVQAVPCGELRFSCPLALSQVALLELLPAFMQRYPEVKVHLLAVNRPVDLVEERVDVALRVRERIEDSSFIARPLAPSPASLFASPALLGDDPPQHPLDLLKLPTLSMAYSNGRHEFALRHAKGEKLTLRHEPRLVTDDMAVLVAAAVAGLGVVQLPDFRCRAQLASGELVRVVPEWLPPPGIVHLVYTHRSGLLPAVRAFIDYLVETLPASICAIMGHEGQANCPPPSAESP
ncbi:MAG TPA: LysR family transcriptional regulator [Hyphomicrobiales bacterium]|nr:LysR family transcriptional regulator [Hyphomicrobiales bacterium]